MNECEPQHIRSEFRDSQWWMDLRPVLKGKRVDWLLVLFPGIGANPPFISNLFVIFNSSEKYSTFSGHVLY